MKITLAFETSFEKVAFRMLYAANSLQVRQYLQAIFAGLFGLKLMLFS